ncbi:HDOD domain-containing protein [Sulfurivermis fontis]|uniref:HDOD domain-containing protein n=1 Tax=Sulfurivermis fontis TaxID=1972068 RepID=UPI0015584802|nr:HDOD domain-containing protein [Sulfurivermis fontis]
MTDKHIRQLVQRQKELPTLSNMAQRILTAFDTDDLDVERIVSVLEKCPTITARLLGLANSAFFGHSGRIHSLRDAVFVLGLVTVKSMAMGMAIAGSLDTSRCPAFDVERYWMTAMTTALLSQQLYTAMPAELRPAGDSVYLAGLLHSIGLLVLVHLYPEEMNQALDSYRAAPESRLADHIQAVLNTDHYQAGIWLGSRWHFPDNLLLVMQYHYDRSYRGEHWPLVLLSGACARCANQMVDGRPHTANEDATFTLFGITPARLEGVWQNTCQQLEAIREMCLILARA